MGSFVKSGGFSSLRSGCLLAYLVSTITVVVEYERNTAFILQMATPLYAPRGCSAGNHFGDICHIKKDNQSHDPLRLITGKCS